WRRRTPGVWRSALIVFGLTAVFWGVSLLTGGEFIPRLARFGIVAIALVGPSFRSLGGVFLILPALGLLLTWRSRGAGRLAAAFFLVTALQSLSLQIAHLTFNVGYYWVEKSFFVWVFPLALLSVFPVAWGIERALAVRRISAPAVAAGFGLTVAVLAFVVVVAFPATFGSPMNEQEIQVALWAREHLDTQQINYISRKGLIPQWLGAGFWGENYPDDLSFGQAQLGPKTYEEWRDDPSWGKYLYITSDQHLPLGPEVKQVERIGDAVIVSRLADQARPAGAGAPEGRFGDALALVDYQLPSRTLRAGDVISFTAAIETASIPAHSVVWRLQLRDPDGSAAAEARTIPFGDKYPLQRWPDGNRVDQQFVLALPDDLTPGRYGLALGLYYVGSGDPLTCHLPDGTTDDVLSLGQIKVELPRPTEQEIGSLTRTDLHLGSAISLLGYRVETNSPAHAGDSLTVYLYWQALATPPSDYTGFVHLLDPSGVLRAQSDSTPRNGAYPTSIWAPDEIVGDPRTLTLPANAPPGEYRIEVGMYEWPSLRRLPVTRAGVVQGDHILLPQTILVQAK
ncbi:MAG: DUF2157 domain-containing protein, partial [Chloroflexi bacterium]|nr:DUF2157 domain-containing protein [Chloroflexota bacterium]